jgi:hypothetical protein
VEKPRHLPGLFSEGSFRKLGVWPFLATTNSNISAKLLKYCDVFQQRNYAKDDHDDARDLLGAAVDRQQVDQIENKDNDEKRNQRTNKHRDSP